MHSQLASPLLTDPTAAIAPILTALRNLPFWILISLALAGYAVLFIPPFGGIDADEFRRQWGVWIWVEAIAFSILAAARSLDAAVGAYGARRRAIASQRFLRFVPLDQRHWWHLAKQKDNSYISQIGIDLQASNTSDRPVQIVQVQLIRPRANVAQADVTLPMAGSPYHSSRHPVPPHGTVPVSVHIMVRKVLGTQGQPIRITVKITDQYGKDYTIKGIVVPSRDRIQPRPSLAERIRRSRAFKALRREALPAPSAMPWTFSMGPEYVSICQSILDEERRCYAARGRQRGGLGSLSARLQSGPNAGWTNEGEIPQLLWSRDKAKPVDSTNLDRLLRVHGTLLLEDRDNLERYLLSCLSKDSEFADIAYFVFLGLHRIGRTIDGLETARAFLAGDKVYGYSNLLGTLSAVVSHEHFDIDPSLYPLILDALEGDEEHDFGLRQKINTARLEHLDRVAASSEASAGGASTSATTAPNNPQR